MLWNKDTLKSSLQSLLGHKASRSARFGRADKRRQADALQLENLRAAMLAELAGAGAQGHEHVLKRLEMAKDVEALWFLRADLLAALTAVMGEEAARRCMAGITPRFHGLLPAALHSRPSRLG